MELENTCVCLNTNIDKTNIPTIINNDEDLSLILKSCAIAASAMNSVFTIISSILMQRKYLNCEEVSEKISFSLKASLKSKAKKFNLAENVRLCSPLKIEGCEIYKLNFRKASIDKTLPSDVVYISLGIDYEKYCSNYARTLLINPTINIKKNYNWMLLIEEKVFNNLQAGIALCKVHEAVISFVEIECPHLLKHLDKELAFGLNPNFRKESVVLTSDANFIARENMIFAISIKLSGLIDEKIVYNLCTSNTVIVRNGKEARPLTLYNNILQNLVIEEVSSDKIKISQNAND